MLRLLVQTGELYDESISEFLPQLVQVELNHSLVSLSKWESIFQKPFLSPDTKTPEETFAYIKLMGVPNELSDDLLRCLNQENLDNINKYIESKQSATTFTEDPRAKVSREKITSEILYHMMIALGIPWECQHWHLNRLLTLIRVCNEKNTPPKKMGGKEAAAQRRALNEQRKSALKTSG